MKYVFLVIQFLSSLIVTGAYAQSSSPKFQAGQDIDKVWRGDKGQFERKYFYILPKLCGITNELSITPTTTQLDPGYVYAVESSPAFNQKILCVKSRQELDSALAVQDSAIEQGANNRKNTRANNREKYSARIDTVAKVLNYSSGCKDEGCDQSTWIVKDTKRCTYQEVLLDDMSTIREIQLNSMDPRLISIATEYISGENRITDTYDWTTKSYVTTVDRSGNNYLVVKYDGMKLFTRRPGDIDRLRRGWLLIYNTYCSGIKKEF